MPVLPAVFRYYALLPEQAMLEGPSSRTAVNRLRPNGTKSVSPVGMEVGGQWINLEEKCTCHSQKGGGSLNNDDEALENAVAGRTGVMRAEDAV